MSDLSNLHEHRCPYCGDEFECTGTPNCLTIAERPRPEYSCLTCNLAGLDDDLDLGRNLQAANELRVFTVELTFGGVTRDEVHTMMMALTRMALAINGTLSVDRLEEAKILEEMANG